MLAAAHIYSNLNYNDFTQSFLLSGRGMESTELDELRKQNAGLLAFLLEAQADVKRRDILMREADARSMERTREMVQMRQANEELKQALEAIAGKSAQLAVEKHELLTALQANLDWMTQHYTVIKNTFSNYPSVASALNDRINATAHVVAGGTERQTAGTETRPMTLDEMRNGPPLPWKGVPGKQPYDADDMRAYGRACIDWNARGGTELTDSLTR